MKLFRLAAVMLAAVLIPTAATAQAPTPIEARIEARVEAKLDPIRRDVEALKAAVFGVSQPTPAAVQPVTAQAIPPGYGRIDSGPNAGQLIRLTPAPTPAPVAAPTPTASPPTPGGCYTDRYGRTVCPYRR